MRIQAFQPDGECPSCQAVAQERTPSLVWVRILDHNRDLICALNLRFHPAMTLQCIGDQLVARWPSTGYRPITDIVEVSVRLADETRNTQPGGGLCCWQCALPTRDGAGLDIQVFVRVADESV